MSRLFKVTLSCFLCLALPCMTSCSDQRSKLTVLNEQITAMREANAAAALELADLNRKLGVLRTQISAQSSKRTEFESKSEKSAAAEAALIKYRTELEESLKKFTEEVATYRKQYLSP